MKRRQVSDQCYGLKKKSSIVIFNQSLQSVDEDETVNEIFHQESKDFSCQVEISQDEVYNEGNSFSCNRFIFENGVNHAEVQNNIQSTRIIISPHRNNFRSVLCGTDPKTNVDKCTDTDFFFLMKTPKNFLVLIVSKTMSS